MYLPIWMPSANRSIFEEYLPEYHNLDELKEHYTRGGLGDVKIKKKILNNVIQEELAPIRARRAEFEKDIPAVYEILKKEVMQRVKLQHRHFLK